MIKVKRKPLTSCADVLPESDEVVIMFKTGEEYRVGRYHPDTKSFKTSGFPQKEFPLEEVVGWKILTSNHRQYVKTLREASVKTENHPKQIDSLSHVVDLRLTGHRRHFKK